MKVRGIQTRRRDNLSLFVGRLLMFLGAATLLLLVFRLLRYVLTVRRATQDTASREHGVAQERLSDHATGVKVASATPPAKGQTPQAALVPRRRAQAARRLPPPRVPAQRSSAQRRKASRRLPWEKILLAVEAGAVLLFVAAGFTLWQTRSNLNDTYRNLQQTDPRALPTLIAAANPGAVAQAQAANDFLAQRPTLPTPFPTVTPVVAAMVEVTVKDDAGAAREASTDQVKATSSTEETVDEWGTTAVMARLGHESNQPRRLQIPAIGVDSFIFQDYGEDWLKLGVVQIGQPVSPGQPGNVVLAAHNDIYGEIFRHLDQIQLGDEIVVLVDQSSYIYHVRETLIVEPDDVWVTLPTTTPTITLVSCYPYLIGTQRIVVFGDLVQ